MVQEITSSQAAAQEAVSGLRDNQLKRSVASPLTFSQAKGIVGMENALKTANQILLVINQFSEATVKQANKIPAIANHFTKMDVEESKRWEGMND